MDADADDFRRANRQSHIRQIPATNESDVHMDCRATVRAKRTTNHREGFMRFGRLNVFVTLGTFALAGLPLAMRAQEKPARVELITGIRHAVSPPMRQIFPTPPSPASGVLPLRRAKPAPSGAPGTDPVLQTTTTTATSSNTTAGFNFDGISSDGYIPPDTNLSVGATQVVQIVNVDYAVYEKSTGTQVQTPRAIHNVFSSLGAPCGTSDGGDPVVLYDKAAGRWLISQLEFNSSFTSNYVCVAVSTTSDATGSFNVYSFAFGSNLPDYPKFGTWPDAYYLTANIFAGGSAFTGATACALPRSLMLAGSPVDINQTVCFQNPSEASLLPADLDGTTQPAAGEPEFFANFDTTLELYQFHVDFNTPSNSTFTGPIPVSGAASFSQACNGGTCIPQPGTGQQLDSLGDRLMFRLDYRNFSTYESLVVTHSVQTGSGSQSGIRWYEIRNPAGTPTVNQQGTFSPDTTTYRWMGSIAQDKNADIAVGYNVSAASSIFPGIRYAGRIPSDSPGTLEAEATIASGSASQSGSFGYRWGDYSAMSIDPSDDCTFWYTTEYIVVGGSFNWNTRIASFKFNGCGSPPTPPAAPTGLAATAGNAQVSLTWNASTGATSYTLLRSVSGGSYSQLISGLTSTSYTDTGLTNGTQYCYEVEAVNSIGPSSPSSPACATPVAPPLTPTGLTATAGNAQVSLAWNASAGATSYTLLRSVSGGSYSTLASALTSTSYTDTGLTNGTQYCYEVEAVNAGGSSSPSGPACATPVGPPPAPTGLTATAGNAQVSLAWNASTGATSYTLLRSVSGGSYTQLISGLASTSYLDTGLTNGTQYCYEVEAVNLNGTSSPSSPACATPQAAPNPPTNLVASGAKRRINLTWTQSTSSGITANKVYRATGTSATPGLLTTLSPTTSFSDTSVTRGQTYCYQVTAVSAGGESARTSKSCAASR